MIRRRSPVCSGTFDLKTGSGDGALDLAHGHVNEGAQAVVLAEIAARVFVARGAVADVLNGIEPDEGGAMTVLVETNGFDRRADCARLAAVFVNDDFRLVPDAVEVRVNEVDFRLHRRQVLLRAALQDEARTQLGEVRNSGDVEEDVLRQNVRQSGEDLFAAPALPLEVHDVGLHEHRAAVAEDRHGVGRERDVGVLVHLVAERFRRALQEVAVAGRALRVQLEVFDAPVFQDDQLDVLAADVHDDVRVLVELHGRFGVGHGFHQRHIGLEHVLQGRPWRSRWCRRPGLPAPRPAIPPAGGARRTCRWCPGSDCRPTVDRPCRARRPASDSSTALVEVEPPSSPTNPRTVSPTANFAPMNFGHRCPATAGQARLPDHRTRLVGDGAEDAAHHQAARRTARPRADGPVSMPGRGALNSACPFGKQRSFRTAGGVTVRAAGRCSAGKASRVTKE